MPPRGARSPLCKQKEPLLVFEMGLAWNLLEEPAMRGTCCDAGIVAVFLYLILLWFGDLLSPKDSFV